MNNVKQAEELVISQKTNAMQKIGSLGKMFFAIYGPDIIVYVKTPCAGWTITPQTTAPSSSSPLRAEPGTLSSERTPKGTRPNGQELIIE